MGEDEDDWARRLDEATYRVTRCGGTEPPFSGRYHDFKGDGRFLCACCSAPLFDSRDKYDSGTGWPSFTRPLAPGAVVERTDHSHGMVRVEVLCAACAAHLGHRFEDGPPPTGQRYCINSLALRFEPRSGGAGAGPGS